jgi:ABC-type transport system involved in Fe-S cluster assembly fused permease/ATPase subunit
LLVLLDLASTIVKLLIRFYDHISGEIRFDQDIKLLDQMLLRRNVGVVPQDTVLFAESIEFNINYWKIGSTIEEVRDIASLADVHDKISYLPDGYKTKVGERGLELSGGEKQRVAIARTFLRSQNSSCLMRPPVLLIRPQRGTAILLEREFARTEPAS